MILLSAFGAWLVTGAENTPQIRIYLLVIIAIVILLGFSRHRRAEKKQADNDVTARKR